MAIVFGSGTEEAAPERLVLEALAPPPTPIFKGVFSGRFRLNGKPLLPYWLIEVIVAASDGLEVAGPRTPLSTPTIFSLASPPAEAMIWNGVLL